MVAKGPRVGRMIAGTAWGREREVIEMSPRPGLPDQVPAEAVKVASWRSRRAVCGGSGRWSCRTSPTRTPWICSR